MNSKQAKSSTCNEPVPQFRRFKIITDDPKQKRDFYKLCDSKGITRDNLMLILQSLAIKC